jgi:dTDP-4-amino-4,6-dideoxygalactose transaminase
MTTIYNSWPLGELPPEFRRPEPEQIRKLGVEWEDPRDIVTSFEQRLADFAGSRFAVTVDCDSNALFLCLRYREVRGEVEIPLRTYASVPMQIMHAGALPVFRDYEWRGIYELGATGIFDSATRYRRNMYLGVGVLQVLSFQIKKRLPIGRGGAILTDDEEAYRWLKLATYDGRDLTTPYTAPNHIQSIGWHYYMTPEDAARGILLMEMLGEGGEDAGGSANYPPLDIYPALQHIRKAQ